MPQRKSNFEKKHNRKPYYVKRKKKGDLVTIHFRPVQVPKMKVVMFFWLIVALVSCMFFYLNMPIETSDLINEDMFYKHIGSGLLGFYSFHKVMMLITTRVIIEITPEVTRIREKPYLLLPAITRFTIRKRDTFQFYVDYRQNVFTKHYPLMMITKKQDVKAVLTTASPNLSRYIEFSIEDHMRITDVQISGQMSDQLN